MNVIQLCPMSTRLVAVFKGKDDKEESYDVHCWGLSSLGAGYPMICFKGELLPGNLRPGFLRIENYKPKL